MLDVMRSNARSSLIVLIFGAIIVTFIFSFGRGSSGFRTRTPETWAARVNDEVVTAGDFSQAYASRFRQMSSQRGGKYTVDDAKQDDLKRLTLQSLVDQELIAQQAKDLGIIVTDQELSDAIAKSPQFQQSGRFDFDYYKRLVENGYGMSVPRFEDAWRRDMLRTKVLQTVLNGAQVSDDEVRAYYIAQHESAAIAYVKFTPFMFRDKAQVTDAEIDEYAKSHQKEIEEAYHRDERTRWTQPASVKVRAITVLVPPGSTAQQEQAARARIDAAAAEVNAGKDFAAVVKERSEDPATKESGGELGFVSRGGSPYGRTLEDEAAKLEPGQMSAVFKDRTGFHVLKAEEKKPPRTQPLEEVRKQIATDLMRSQKAAELAKAKAQETLAAVKAGKDLKELYPAKKTEEGQFDFTSFTTPQFQETEPFHPVGGVPGVGLAPKLSAAVFALTSPGATPAAPVQNGETWYVFRLKNRERADLSKLDETERKSLRDRIERQKQEELYQSWLQRLRKKSKIVENVAMLDYDTLPGHEVFNPED